jgi:hypothetical protein
LLEFSYCTNEPEKPGSISDLDYFDNLEPERRTPECRLPAANRSLNRSSRRIILAA